MTGFGSTLIHVGPRLLHTLRQRLNRKWQKVAQIWLPGILFCYQIAGVPRHNLEIEAIYGTLQDKQHRISGRKDTSPLRLFGAGETMALLIETEAGLLKHRFQK